MFHCVFCSGAEHVDEGAVGKTRITFSFNTKIQLEINESRQSMSSSYMESMATVSVPSSADVLSVEFSPDGHVLTAGTGDCTILQLLVDRLFKVSSTILNSSMTSGEDLRSPPVCMRFAPDLHSRGSDATTAGKNMLLVACADGGLSQWHLGSARKLQSARFETNPVYAIDYAPNGGDLIAAGGHDGLVRILDARHIGTVVQHMKLETDVDWVAPGSLRIQSLKHIDSNVVISGGWSRTAHLWDRRVLRAVARIPGPYLCGDGIDAHGTTVVTASFREEDPLQIWDLRSLDTPVSRNLRVASVAPPRATPQKLVKGSYSHLPPSPTRSTVNMDSSIVSEGSTVTEGTIETKPAEDPIRPSLFTAKFCPSGTRLVVGGNMGQLHMYLVATGEEITADTKSIHYSKGVAAASVATQDHSIFSVAWSPDGRSIGIGGGHGLCLGVSV